MTTLPGRVVATVSRAPGVPKPGMAIVLHFYPTEAGTVLPCKASLLTGGAPPALGPGRL